MLRRILVLIFVLALGVALVFGYLHITKTKSAKQDPFVFVPIHAPITFSISDPLKAFSTLSDNNLIWNEIKDFEAVRSIDSLLHASDSVYASLVSTKVLASESMLISLVQSGSGSFSPLYIFQVQSAFDYGDLTTLTSVFSEFTINQKSYDEQIYIELSGEKFDAFGQLYLFEQGGLVALSHSHLVIEDVIRQSSSDLNLLLDESLARIKLTSNPKNDANIFINPATLESLFSKAVKTNLVSDADAFSLWGEMDISIKPNAFRLNGFLHLPDSLSYFLSSFKHQATSSFASKDYVSTDASWYYALGISDVEAYNANYKNYLKQVNAEFDYTKKVEALIQKIGADTLGDYLKLIDGEIGVFARESYGQPEEEKTYGLFKLSQIERLELLTGVEEIENETIYPWKEEKLIADYFGGAFSVLRANYFMIFDKEYVVLANSEFALRDYLGNYYSSRIWGSTIRFEKLEDNLSSSSNLFFYLSPKNGIETLKKYGSEAVAIFAEIETDKTKKLQSITGQISYESGNLYYANAYINYDSNVESSSTSLWEIQLDTSIHAGPYLFTNHYTGAKEIVVQDSLNQLYLISNSGKVLWKKQLDGKIFDGFEQVDRYKNKKYQLLVNTEKSVYLIDRKGRDVEDFPIRLSQKISHQLSLMDYDKDLNYRILIPTQSGNLLNYTLEGKAVKGWEFTPFTSPIVSPVFHFTVKKKDYLLCKSKDGRLKAIARNGKDRLNFKTSFKGVGDLKAFESSTLEESFVCGIDLDSNLVKLYLNDEVEIKEFENPVKSYLLQRGESGKAEFIYAFYDHIESDKDNLIQFMHTLPVATKGHLVLAVVEGEPAVFYDDQRAGQIRYIKIETNRSNLYPYSGNGSFIVGDVNQDELEDLILLNKYKTLKLYSL